MENLVNQQHLTSIYQNKKVFLTGHTGFKGSWLLLWLIQSSATVKGYSLAPEQDDCLFNQIKTSIPFENIIADIRNKEKLEQEIINFQPDFVFHLAAQPLVRRSYRAPSETFETNVLGTSHVLEAITKLNKKCTMVVITTDKVYENKEQDILYKESDRLGGYDPYSASKACTELVVSSFRNSFFSLDTYSKHQKAIAVARAGNVIGGGDFSEDRIIPDIVRALKNNKEIEVRNPNAIRPWQHVLEPLAGYLILGGLLDKEPYKFSTAYNFGPLPDDHLYVKDLVALAIKTWQSGSWKDTSDPSQPHEATLLKLDISKANEELNWTPKLKAAEAIQWTMNWYKNEDDIFDLTMQQINEYMRK